MDNSNEPNINGTTPIFVASQNGHTDVVKLLASKVENPNEPRTGGVTPIFIASQNGYTKIVKFLAPKVDNPNESKTSHRPGMSPIHVVANNGNCQISDFHLR